MVKRFEVVMNVPAPYRQYLYKHLWLRLKDRGINFHMHYMARGFKARPDSWMNPQIDFPHTYWRNWGTSEHQFNPGLIAHLLANQPDYLMCGSSFYTYTGIAIMLGCTKSLRIAGLEGNTKTPGVMNGIKGFTKRLVLSKCKYVALPGEDAVRYIGLHQALTKRKMPTCVYLPNLVDETRFRPREFFETATIEAVRRQLGVKMDDRVCLVSARLTEVKGLVPFVSLLNAQLLNGWKIVILGRGELRDKILETVHARGIVDAVKICDFVSYEEMPQIYAASDLLLLPSLYDPNPLSVIEALHTGLPIALTCMAGNVEEAITEGNNGWVLPVLDKSAFAEKLQEIFTTPIAQMREMGARSRTEKAQFWNTERCIREFLDQVL